MLAIVLFFSPLHSLPITAACSLPFFLSFLQAACSFLVETRQSATSSVEWCDSIFFPCLWTPRLDLWLGTGGGLTKKSPIFEALQCGFCSENNLGLGWAAGAAFILLSFPICPHANTHRCWYWQSGRWLGRRGEKNLSYPKNPSWLYDSSSRATSWVYRGGHFIGPQALRDRSPLWVPTPARPLLWERSLWVWTEESVCAQRHDSCSANMAVQWFAGRPWTLKMQGFEPNV